VANGWLTLQADEELLDISRRTLATREDSLALAKMRREVGLASDLDYRQAESLAEAARATLAQQQRQRALDENALALLLGQPLPDDIRASLAGSRLASVPAMADLPAGLPSDLLTQRPDIRQAEQQLIAANASIGAARAAFFPSITLTAQAGTASTELSDLFKSGSWAFTPTVSALLPVFNAGRNQAALDAAKAGRAIAVAQYEKAIQSAFREVSDALANNRDLRVAALAIEQARAQFQIQRAAQWPSVGVGATASRAPSASTGSLTNTYSVGGVLSAWELDFFGRLGSLKEQALAQYLASEEGRKAVQVSLVAGVANGWLTLQADEELLDISRRTLATREDSLALAK
ncbi:MAG: TolC family protein, partial [Acidovorax sp.]|nr:TolC family protein [Acidovorax sp.]